MPQRSAFLISAALTALILLTGVGLTARLLQQHGAATADAADGAAAADADADQDSLYQETVERLEEANAALSASYERIATLRDDVEQLRAQNEQLRAREAEYQQRLADATSRLQHVGQTAPPAGALAAPAPRAEQDRRASQDRRVARPEGRRGSDRD